MTIPKEVKDIIAKLEEAGFEAFVVGGCVRDLLLASPKYDGGGRGEEPEDWDITTNAKPEEIRKLFTDSFYENKFLTVTVKTKSSNAKLKEIEITTYRSEAKYSDKRHPDVIQYADSLQDDLKRRDFTINAMAMGQKSQALNSKSKTNYKFKILNPKLVLVDLFDGQKDLKNKIIRTVGNPEDRFEEDALRMLRAVRLATTLGFKIEPKTAKAIRKNSIWLEAISQERIRDELLKIITADKAAEGVELLRELGLLKYVLPELEEGYGVGQNKHHIYDCYWHSVKALEYSAQKKFSWQVRLASLLHDIAKPRVKVGQGENSTFYNHEVVGAKMTFQILNRLKFPKKDIEKITKLVRYHLFYYNVGEVGESSVRRLVKNMGPATSSLDEVSLASLRRENMEDLLKVRQADRIGSGVPKAEPYKLRHLKYLIERVSKDPISAKMLKVSGNDVIDVLKAKPGPKVGQILDVLLGYVLNDPKKNEKDFLAGEIKKLGELEDKKLESLANKSKAERMKIETKRDEMTKAKYWVT